MSDICKLGSYIVENDNYDLLVKVKDTEEIIDVANAMIEDNKVTAVYSTDGKYYLRDEIIICNKVLYIPGVGYITPGTRVVYKNKDYLLGYGWHTNISNQNILSWYLDSLESNTPMKTLYKEMVNEINLVHFR